LNAAAGSLSAIGRLVKITVFVASTPDFTSQPQVADGASRLFLDVLGEAGAHARSAIGVAALPLGTPVEVEAIPELGSCRRTPLLITPDDILRAYDTIRPCLRRTDE